MQYVFVIVDANVYKENSNKEKLACGITHCNGEKKFGWSLSTAFE